MTGYCTLSDLISWFTCVQVTGGLPFAEIITMVTFVVFFMVLKSYPTREALPSSLFIATVVSLSFYGMGLGFWGVPVLMVILTALSAVFLSNQNS